MAGREGERKIKERERKRLKREREKRERNRKIYFYSTFAELEHLSREVAVSSTVDNKVEEKLGAQALQLEKALRKLVTQTKHREAAETERDEATMERR